MSDADLARQLGVSKALVSRDKGRGMPVHSLEAATAWRNAHLELARRKDRNPARAGAGRSRAAAGASVDLAQVQRIASVAQAAMAVGLFAHAAPELRQALADIPQHARPAVRLAPELWNALCAHVWPDGALSAEPADAPTQANRPARAMTGRELTIYAIAAGEPVDEAWLDGWE